MFGPLYEHDLVDAFKYAMNKVNPFVARFTLTNNETADVIVMLLRRYDHVENWFEFMGFEKLGLRSSIAEGLTPEGTEKRRVHGVFNPVRQTGWIEPGWHIYTGIDLQ